MNTVLLYIKRFATSTYYGIRQSLLQAILLFFFVQTGILGIDQRCFWALGGEIASLSIFIYTILNFWLNDFTPRLHALFRIIVPYILCALIIYLRIEFERNGGWDVQKTSLYDFTHLDNFLLTGLLLPLYSLLIIGVECLLETLLADESKRIVSIAWNALTILLIALLSIIAIIACLHL